MKNSTAQIQVQLLATLAAACLLSFAWGCREKAAPRVAEPKATNLPPLSSIAPSNPAPAIAATNPVNSATTEFKSAAGTRVRIEGTSTIHDWHTDGLIIAGSLRLPTGFKLTPDLKPGLVSAQADIRIPVRTLKSGGGPVMDRIMQEAMNTKQYPDIKYRVETLKLIALPESGKPARCEATGVLSICASNRAVTFPVELENPDSGKWTIRGQTPIKMTDYGIKPPEPILVGGAIKTGNDVKVLFEWKVASAVPENM